MAIYRRDIRQVAKKFEEKLTDLLWMCSREELQQFIIGYAKEQPDIHDALHRISGLQKKGDAVIESRTR